MAFNIQLADRIRDYLSTFPGIVIEEKVMFAVLNFMVNGKTCICVSGDRMMLRFDPLMQEELSERMGYETMLMKGKEYKGYCYISPEGFRKESDFKCLVGLCLSYNQRLKSTAKSERNKSGRRKQN